MSRRPRALPGVESQSKQMRLCAARGCGEEVRGDRIARHYRMKTDFNKLNDLRKLSKEAADDVKQTLDPHIRYMYENNHT